MPRVSKGSIYPPLGVAFPDLRAGLHHVRPIHVSHCAPASAEEVETYCLLCSLGHREAPREGILGHYVLCHLVDDTSIKLPVEINRDASFKDLRALLGRWMGAPPDNVSVLSVTLVYLALNPILAPYSRNFQPPFLQKPR